jgi:type I restriction enzyme, S subunit
MISDKDFSNNSDSVIDWIGKIPTSWDVRKTKHLFKLVCEQAPANNNQELLSIYTAIGVRPRKDLEARGNKATTTDNYWIVKKGDIIVNKLLAWMGAVGISEYEGVTSPAYDILRAREGVNPYYYNYLFRSPLAFREFKRHSRGIMDVRLRLYFSEFGNIFLPFPKIEEQTAIARFLDYKLAKINRFIQKKKQLIKLLNEQKAAIINQAVTKGLDPNAKMKDSGIEWLGEIPEHWEVRKLKYVANCFPSNIDKHSKEDEKQVRLCNYTDVYKNDYITDSMDLMLATATDEQIEKFTLLQGDVIITKDSETANDIAVPAYVKEPLTNVVCGYHLSVLRPYETLYGEFLFRILQCKEINIQFEVRSNGVTRVGLGVYDLKNAKIPVPSHKEQSQIVDFISKETATIYTTISKIEKELALTEEYKTALIAEAVTGKIDVREYQVPEIMEEVTYEEIEEEISMAAEEQENYEIE